MAVTRRFMLGPEGVANAVVDRLGAEMPSRLADMRMRYGGLSQQELPDMVNIWPVQQDLTEISQFPCIFVVEVDTDGRVSNQQLDTDAFGEEYAFRYRMRAFVWTIGEDSAYVATAIRRYVLAIREIMLHNKLLHESTGNHAAIDPATIRESIGDMGVDDNGLRLGMAYVEFDVMTQESLSSYAPRPVTPPNPDGIRLDMSKLAIHVERENLVQGPTHETT